MAQLPARPLRSSPWAWARLLTVCSLTFLLLLIGWQVWLRLGVKQDSDAPSLPAEPPGGNAATGPKLKDDDSGEDDAFAFRDNSKEQLAAAATLVGMGVQGGAAAPGELAVMAAGQKGHLWVLSDIESALPLRTKFLSGVTDSQPIADGKIAGKSKLEWGAYIQALDYSALTPQHAFANSVREDVNYAQLYSEPWNYRGDVIHVEGRLKRVRRFDPPPAAEHVRDLYEGWMFLKERGSEPVCLLFTELPEGLSVTEKTEVPVAFDGYFFKRYRYKAADSGLNQAREAPLLIGRTLVLKGPVAATPETDGGAGGPSLLVGFLGLVVLTVAFAVGITWWFRHDERRVQSRLADALAREFQPPPADDAPEPGNLDGSMDSEAIKTSQTPLPGQLFAPDFTKDPNIREDAD
jgi:hypothetical protein